MAAVERWRGHIRLSAFFVIRPDAGAPVLRPLSLRLRCRSVSARFGLLVRRPYLTLPSQADTHEDGQDDDGGNSELSTHYGTRAVNTRNSLENGDCFFWLHSGTSLPRAVGLL